MPENPRQFDTHRSTAIVNEKRFFLLSFSGLAKVSLQELKNQSDSSVEVTRLPNYDLVELVLTPAEIDNLPRLRTVEDVFWKMGSFPVSKKSDLNKLTSLIQKDLLLKGLALKNRLFHPKKPKQPNFNCFVKQDRDRSIYRKEIATKMVSTIATIFPKWKIRDPASVELWGFYIQHRLHLAFRLSDNRMRYRAQRPFSRPGALRPTIAAALIQAANPLPNETVVDPMCGTGAILAEGMIFQKRATFIGGDSDPEALVSAKQRLWKHDLCLREWDATQLPLELSSIDCFVCNLPFGQQYSTAGNNRDLYPRLVSNWLARLKPKGRIVLLTADTKTMGKILGLLDLKWKASWKVKVLGTWATTYRIWKE